MSFVIEPQMTADFRMDVAVKKDCDTESLSIATKNQPFSQGGWSGCGFLIATCGLAD